jgi:hypothetical protein
MVRLFPELATLNLSKKSGHAEVRLKDNRSTDNLDWMTEG